MHRVVITGTGVVSALGRNTAEFCQSLFSGTSAIRELLSVDTAQLRFKHGAEIRDYTPEKHFETKDIAFMDRFAQFAVLAAREAISHAGIAWSQELRETTAVITGSCLGGKFAEESGYWELFHNGRNRVQPLTIPLSMSNAGASHIGMQFGIEGPTYTVSTACASSTHAIGQAFWMVRSGAAPMAIAGGSEAPFFLGGLKAWEAMRVISKDTCRPFSAERSGMVLGEGAAMLVLETLDAALARGARPIAEIVGFGMSADASHITQPLATGPSRAMRLALRDGGLAPEQIGYINAHGTATEANDRIETAAIRSTFGSHADKLAVSSTKSMHGHALGAAGALEAVASALSLKHGMLPPTANFLTPDPACNLDVVPNEVRVASVEACLSNSFAFGGLNAVLAFKAL
ncbi:beta-ketoacyl-[acyl-carrier-protein] synthase family protein [Silvibacterium dinghuense]|uniref:Nodulation protein E n=1 Tax=Silvibacterium dinghuense TaxID=1560006 RepID=A0A4Q1S962_9BACT|nr:beta-ketoacyl-[acyl-carrier-protein] synthase family protein [Silvibacterium dinghuense]RXS93429.1 beta-ketoacyl-[acyl-carrier-protein] synthase family protein [Silvibacterium dinghuense]GGH05728.1 3-oxoacyl-ACP synthase II [Silvibacterium dinghuense]